MCDYVQSFLLLTFIVCIAFLETICLLLRNRSTQMVKFSIVWSLASIPTHIFSETTLWLGHYSSKSIPMFYAPTLTSISKSTD